MPCRAEEKDDRSGRHYCGFGLFTFGLARIIPVLTAGDDHGCAIFCRKLINSPDCGRAKRGTRAGQAIKGVIEMQALGVFARKNIDDLTLRQQKTGLKQFIEQA